MGRGARPSREFIDGYNRKAPHPNQFDRPAQEPEQPPHMDLRIRRYLLDIGSEQFACEAFLKDVGRENRAAGSVRNIGSIAITMLPSRIVNDMLREKYPRDYHSATRKERLFSKVRSDLRHHLSDAEGAYADQKAIQMASKREGQLMRGEIEPLNSTITVEDEDQLLSHPYGEARLAVKGIELYGRKWGFDLSLDTDDILKEEREGIRSHLRRMGLDVQHYRGDFGRHHASFYDSFDHVGDVPLEYDEDIMPRALLFEAPSVQILTVPVEKS